MNDISKKNINIYWKLLGIYIISRIIISFLGIEPIAEDLSHRWQLMPPELLKKDFGTNRGARRGLRSGQCPRPAYREG